MHFTSLITKGNSVAPPQFRRKKAAPLWDAAFWSPGEITPALCRRTGVQ
jgi:hypothetical protein